MLNDAKAKITSDATILDLKSKWDAAELALTSPATDSDITLKLNDYNKKLAE